MMLLEVIKILMAAGAVAGWLFDFGARIVMTHELALSNREAISQLRGRQEKDLVQRNELLNEIRALRYRLPAATEGR